MWSLTWKVPPKKGRKEGRGVEKGKEKKKRIGSMCPYLPTSHFTNPKGLDTIFKSPLIQQLLGRHFSTKELFARPSLLFGATVRPQGRREAWKQSLHHNELASPKPYTQGSQSLVPWASHPSLHQNGLVYGEGGKFPLEPGDGLICSKTGPASEIELFFGLVTSDTIAQSPTLLPGPPRSPSHPQQEINAGNGGGIQHP